VPAIIIIVSLVAQSMLFRPKPSLIGDGVPHAFESALTDMRQDNRWEAVMHRKVQGCGDLRVWKQVPAGRLDAMAVKASIDIPCVPAGFFADVLLTRDYELARTFNPTLEGGKDLQWIDGDSERISHVKTLPVLIMKPRDFVVHVRRQTLRDGTELILNSDTTHELAPPTATHVRGRINGLHLVEPVAGGGCRYTSVHQMDPAGSVPMPVVNWFALRRPQQYMIALQGVAEKLYTEQQQQQQQAQKHEKEGRRGPLSVMGGGPARWLSSTFRPARPLSLPRWLRPGE
jgi:hypothetical protein